MGLDARLSLGRGLRSIRPQRYRSPVRLLCLTGGICSGKSTVSSLLAQRGAVIIDADAITRELQAAGSPVFDAMVARFGSGIVGADGELDRQAVADLVFNDGQALADPHPIDRNSVV